MFMVLVDTKGCIWRFWASFLHSSWKIDWDRMFQSKKFNTLRTFDLKQSKRAQMAFTALVDPKGCIWHFWGSFLDSSWKIVWDRMFQFWKLDTRHAFVTKHNKRAQIMFMVLVDTKGCIWRFWGPFLDSSWKIEWDGLLQSWKFNTQHTFEPKQAKRAKLTVYDVSWYEMMHLTFYGGHF